MKTIVIAGGSGTIGTKLKSLLANSEYRVCILTRNKEKADKDESFIHWDIGNGYIDEQFDNQVEVVINLAGAGIADGRWTPKRKRAIIDSRIESNKLLIETAKSRKIRLKNFISASAIGFYGNGGNSLLTEDTDPMTDEFLSQVCVLWEESADLARSISDHLCILRIGTVLSEEGGALEKMDQTIPFGVANYLGNGKQLMSWIHVTDVSEMIIFAMKNNLQGIYNAVAPEVVSNKNFTKILRDVVNPRALVLPAPALGIKVIFGEMARVVLNSSNVSSQKIQKEGFQFSFPDLKTALEDLYQNK